MAAPYGTHPTPLYDFGERVEWGPEFETFRVVPTGAPVTATYRDSKPRAWQDRRGGSGEMVASPQGGIERSGEIRRGGVVRKGRYEHTAGNRGQS